MDDKNATREKVIPFIESLSGYFMISGIDIEEGIVLCSSFIIKTCVRIGIRREDFKDLLQKMMDTYMQIEEEFVEEE